MSTHLTCPECNTALKTKTPLPAGKKIKCPKCGTVFAVPGEAASAPSRPAAPPRKPPPARAKPRPPVEEVEEREEDEPLSRKPARTAGAKKKGSSGLVWAGVGVLLLLIAGGAVAAFVYPGFLKKQPEAVQKNPTPVQPAVVNTNTPGQSATGNNTTPAAPESSDPKELILGHWQNEDPKDGTILDFSKDGSVAASGPGNPGAKGTYKFPSDNTMEVSLSLGGQTMTQKFKIQVSKDELTTTDEQNKVDKFKRGTTSGPPTAASGWQEFTSTEGNFAVQFPGTPKQSSNPDASGKPSPSFEYVAPLDNGMAMYNVSYGNPFADPTKAVPPKAFFDSIAAKYGQGVKTKKDIQLNGFPGMELVMQGDQKGTPIMMDARYYMVGERMYQVMVVYPPGKEGPAQVQKFLDSFRLLNPPTNPTATSPTTSPTSPAGTTDPRQGILGKWKVDSPEGTILDFGKDGSLTINQSGLTLKGTYQFLDDNTLAITGPGQTQPDKARVQITDQEMVTTDSKGKVERAHRVTGAEAQAAQADWKEFTSRECGFAVLFPGTPKEETTKDAKGTVTHTVQAIPYTVMCAEGFSTKEVPPKVVLEGIAARIGQELKSKKDIQLAGHPGVEVVMERKQNNVTMTIVDRIYIANDHMYQVMAMRLPGLTDTSGEQKFLDSFRFLDQGGSPAPGTSGTTPPPAVPGS